MSNREYYVNLIVCLTNYKKYGMRRNAKAFMVSPDGSTQVVKISV